MLTVTLPSEVELISGSLHWSGDVLDSQPIGLDLTIRVRAEGKWFVYVQSASYDELGAAPWLTASEAIYLQSSAVSGEVIQIEREEITPQVHQYDPSWWTPTPTVE